ncbi:unnamed protein product, partial [marine sediment metagenome]
MKNKKKESSNNKKTKLAVIENNVLHIKEFVDKLYDKMGSIEKNLNQVGLNEQSINTLKNNVKNINDTRIPNLKKKIGKKVDSTAFYVIIGTLSIV